MRRVMPAYAGIHVFATHRRGQTWMAGTSPAMTIVVHALSERTVAQNVFAPFTVVSTA